MLRRDRDGHVLAENRLKALDAACQMPVDPSMAQAPPGSFTRSAVGPSVRASDTFGGTTWQSLGPQPMQSVVSGRRNWGVVAGRVDAIAISPADRNVILLGGATGGIWKSTDGGTTWRPVSDSAPALAISHIAFSPATPSVVFAATGEVDNGGHETSPATSFGTYLGGGLLKSTDGGETWFRVDTNLPSNAVFSRVIPHRTDPNLVVVGVYASQNVAGNSSNPGGVFRSTDGGVTFTQTLPHVVSDLAQDPNTANRLYLATGACGTCGASGVWGSTDFGQTWTPVQSAPAGTEVGNTKIGVGRTAPTVIYASFLKSDNSHSGISRSDDAGANWTAVTVDPTMCPVPGSGNGTNQCDYDHWIAPDPVNPSTVYFGSIDLYKSTDGGATWSNILNVYADTGPNATTHPDQHTAVFAPDGTLFVGNDGGIYRSTDGGASFQSLNASLDVAQFNTISLHPTDAGLAMGGTQDNGNQRYTGSATWSDRTQGDGGFNLFRRDAAQEVLSAHYQANLEFSSDSGASYADVTPCGKLMNCTTGEPLDTMAFYVPAVAAAAQPRTVFLGTNRVWVNDTFGQDPTHWSARTPAKVTDSYFTSLDVPGADPGPVWAGAEAGSIFFSTDGGATFTPRFTGLPGAPVTRILSVTADGRSAYATFAGYLGLPSRHVFRTTDAGVTWTNISNNLPDVPILDIKVDPTDPNDLFLASDVGVFRSTNGGASWATFNAGLPNVPVYQLAYHPVTNDLWAATYGRGVWRVANATGGPSSCVEDAATMCLVGGRYRVQSHWKNQYAGGAVSTLSKAKLTDVTGAFWIANADTYEYLIRFNTATNNGRVWIAIPTFTDVEFWIDVTDTRTGQSNEYHSPAGNRTLLYDPNFFVYP